MAPQTKLFGSATMPQVTKFDLKSKNKNKNLSELHFFFQS